MLVVAVPEQHRMDMRVPKSRQHIHPFGGNHFRTGRHLQFPHLADRLDSVALDQDDAVRQRRPAKPIDQSSADECDRRSMNRLEADEQHERRDPKNQPHRVIIEN
jgi:hypothetical protein